MGSESPAIQTYPAFWKQSGIKYHNKNLKTQEAGTIEFGDIKPMRAPGGPLKK